MKVSESGDIKDESEGISGNSVCQTRRAKSDKNPI